jgi:hypothetical protein
MVAATMGVCFAWYRNCGFESEIVVFGIVGAADMNIVRVR